MPKTIQIRDLDDDVYAVLVRRAAEDSITVPELLRREATRLASRPSMKEWLAETRRPRGSTRTTPETAIPVESVIESLDVLRGPWPDDRD